MRVVNRVEFMKLPCGTIFSEWDGNSCIGMLTKGKSIYDGADYGNDYTEAPIIDSIENSGTESLWDQVDLLNKGDSVSLDLEFFGRNGMFEQDQKYAIYEEADLLAMVQVLQDGIKAGRSKR